MKTKNALICLAAAALAATSCSKKKEAAHMETMPVDVAYAVTDSVLISKTYPGTISAQNSVDIVGRVNGTLLAQHYQGGDHVKKGQVLFTIEDTQYRDAVKQAEASLANAKSAYAYAEKHYAAMQKALESDAVAQIQVLEAKNAYEQSAAAIKNAEAALQTARTNLSYCTITAPFDGMMTKGTYSPGAYIGGAGAPVTMGKLYDNTHMYADFYLEDNAYEKSLVNQEGGKLIDFNNVPVTFSENLPHSYSGQLKYVAPAVDTSTGTLLLRINLDSPYGELRDGMYCTVSLPYKYDPNAIMVKDAAISTSQTQKFLYVVNDSNKVVYTPIETGDLANDSMRVVTSGLKGGERYVTKALLKVRPGMEVQPIVTK